MIYVHKILPYFIYPTTIILVLMILGVLFKKRSLWIASTILFVLTSSPIISNGLASYLENGQSKKTPTQINHADAIVVLSGMLTSVETPTGIGYEWNDPDRFFGGIELVKSEKANHIIFTSGKLPWQKNQETEGYVLARFAKDWGVKSNAIRITKEVKNTEEEAKAVKELLTSKQNPKIILVTSAFHMKRAEAIFEKQGLEVQTYPVDFKFDPSDITLMDFLPSAHATRNFEFSLRELLGRLYYQIKGL
jgi:uncharacterized SAM-binding protein YcdF (DUF218 family)